MKIFNPEFRDKILDSGFEILYSGIIRLNPEYSSETLKAITYASGIRHLCLVHWYIEQCHTNPKGRYVIFGVGWYRLTSLGCRSRYCSSAPVLVHPVNNVQGCLHRRNSCQSVNIMRMGVWSCWDLFESIFRYCHICG